MFYNSVLFISLVCDVIPSLADSHIVGVGKPIFGRNHDPIIVLASGHFYNWLEVVANYYTSQIAKTSVKNQSYCEEILCACLCVCLCVSVDMYAYTTKYLTPI